MSSEQASPTTQDLVALEEAVGRALAARDVSGLRVLGFGELSVALGWPTDEPRYVCKRTPPFTPAEFGQYRDLVDRYRRELGAHSVDTAPTTVHSLDPTGNCSAYLIQPLLPAETLGDTILADDDPDAEHPLLGAIGEAISIASPSISVDAQVTNWSWDGATLTLLDVGTPFLWSDDGTSGFDMSPFLTMLPAPIRPFVRRDLTKLMGRWQTPRGVAADLVANLFRIELDAWVDPAVEALNRAIEPGDPLTAAEARALHAEDVKTWPRLKKLQQLERAWQSKVRRRPYPYFIQDTISDNTSRLL